MPKSLVILLADGFEEVEFCLPFDLCHRAGIAVTLVAVPTENVNPLQVTGSHGLQLQAHLKLAEFLRQATMPDAVFLPGGMPGSKNLAENAALVQFLKEYAQTLQSHSRYLAAICAAPAHVLGKACGLLQKYTCYPGAETVVPQSLAAQKINQPVVEDANIITASGVGSAHLLAEVLIQRLAGQEKAKQIMEAVLCR